MSRFEQALGLWRYVCRHPANRNDELAATGRLLRWQAQKHLLHRSMVVEVGDGRRFKIVPDSKFSSLVYYTCLPDWDEMNFLLRVLRPEDGFIDIGANVGFYTVLASRRLPPKSLWAIEANPANVAVIKEQIELNGLAEATVFGCALGAQTGRLQFCSGARETGAVVAESGTGTIEVECRRLDDLLPFAILPVDTIAKIDVEGYEVEVLYGARDLLASGRIGSWLFELSADNLRAQGRTVAEFLDAFRATGYDFYRWDEEGRELSPVDPVGGFSQNYIACCRGASWLKQRLHRQ